MGGLDTFFRPESIAIIGASIDVNSINGRPLKFLMDMGYGGRVYPINPKYESILGAKCYPDISALPEVPDMALIAVNARVATRVLADCKAAGVRHAIVFSSGFAEAGATEVQKELDRVLAQGGTRVLGPNCQGMVNLFDKVPATFSAAVAGKKLISGPAAFLSQSGALGFSTFDMGQSRDVGFGYVVTTGNQCDIEVTELAEHILRDDRINVVICYVEGVRSAENLRRAARTAREVGKPLCVLKVGKSSAGEKAAKSHTASLTGSARVFDAFARQENLVLLDDIEDVLNAAAVFGPGKRPLGNRMGIITSSGGAGILMADRCEELGLSVPELPSPTQAVIRKYIPPFGSARNPVDLTAQVVNEASQFRACLDAMVESSDIDVVVVMMTMIVGQPGAQVAADVIDVSRLTTKPIVVCWTIGSESGPMLKTLAGAGVPTYTSPAACARSVALMVRHAERSERLAAAVTTSGDLVRESPGARGRAESLLADAAKTRKPLTEHEAKSVLKAYGINVTNEQVAMSEEEARRLAGEIGFPVALKVSSPDIPHKTEAGAVRLGVNSEEEVVSAYREIVDNARKHSPHAHIDGVLVQEMISGGAEAIIGTSVDPQFGPMVMFGLGGIFVEVLKDVSFRVAPVPYEEALDMIKETKAYSVLLGARGRPRADIEALADLIVKVSRLAASMPAAVGELDLNPVMVLPEGKGVKVVDALMIVREEL